MNHAFLIMVHKEPDLLCRLVNKLYADNHFFYIHVDKKSEKERVSNKALQVLINKAKVRYVKSLIDVKWGGVSMIYATLDLLKNVINDNSIQINYIHLISGQDYPIVKSNVFDKYFEDSNSKGWMSYDEKWSKTCYLRLNIWHFNEFINTKNKMQYFVLRVINKIQRILFNYKIYLRKQFPLPIYAGSQWFSLDIELTRYVLKFINNNPWYLKRFNKSLCADELFFHCILFNSKYKDKIIHNNFRYIDWSEGLNSPKTLKSEDFEKIIHSDCVLARKFSIKESDELLLNLDRYIDSSK